jgi:hypothetical protein
MRHLRFLRKRLQCKWRGTQALTINLYKMKACSTLVNDDRTCKRIHTVNLHANARERTEADNYVLIRSAPRSPRRQTAKSREPTACLTEFMEFDGTTSGISPYQFKIFAFKENIIFPGRDRHRTYCYHALGKPLL